MPKLTYEEIKTNYLDNDKEVWGYNYIPNNFYEFKPAILRKPEKGIIKHDGSRLHYDRNIHFYPLNKKGQPIKSRKIQFKNLHYALNEQAATDEFNKLIDIHLKNIQDLYSKIEEYKI